MNKEQALWESMLLWRELCNAEHYTKIKITNYLNWCREKESAIRKLGMTEMLRYKHQCSLCETYLESSCRECPWPGKGLVRCDNEAGIRFNLYARWRKHPCPETAKPIYDLMVHLWVQLKPERPIRTFKRRRYSIPSMATPLKSNEIHFTDYDSLFPEKPEFKVGDRVKITPPFEYVKDVWPVWCDECKMGGTVERIGGMVSVRFDNGRAQSFSFSNPGLVHLTEADRLYLANRKIEPGDVFDYWGGEKLVHPIAVSHPNDIKFVKLINPDTLDDTDYFESTGLRRVGSCIEFYPDDICFERLVKVGRGKLKIEME